MADSPQVNPRTLEGSATQRIAWVLLGSAVPQQLRRYVPYGPHTDHVDVTPGGEPLVSCGTHFQRPRPSQHVVAPALTIDDVVLASTTRNPQLLQAKDLLKKHLSGVQRWWDGLAWVAGRTRRCVRQECTELLTLHSSSCVSPLFQLLLELLFGVTAGTGKMVKTLSPEDCDTLAKFLLNLGNFGISSLFTCDFLFASPSVILQICRQSPSLDYIHLSVDYAKGEVVRTIGREAKSVEKVVVVVREYQREAHNNVQVVLECQDLQDNLYHGFFDGLTKAEVERRVVEGVECPLSFPNLKCVDVGSSREVRDFLMHLLYLYPRVLSVMYDHVGWCLSKYSLNWPVTTASSLDYSCESLEGKVTEYHLKDICFSSYCMSELSVEETIAKYKEVDHVGLFLIKGSRHMQIANNKAKEIIAGVGAKCLTISVETYMSRRHLLNIYTPTLEAVGSLLRVFQLQLTNEVSALAICDLVNLCPNLEEFILLCSCERCEVEWSDVVGGLSVNVMPRLKSLCFSSRYHVTNTMYELMECLINASPNLDTLELELGGTMTPAWLAVDTHGRFNLYNLRVLRINIPDLGLRSDQILPEFLQPLIKVLPRLSCLILAGVCECFVRRLRRCYGNTGLKVLARTDPILAFRSVAARIQL